MSIYYFSRTGTSEKLAKELAKSKSANIYEIKDNMNWKGVIGFIKAGYYSSSKKSIPATYKKPETDEEIFLITPLWAGTFPPAVRTFIEEVTRSRISLVVTSGGSILKDREGFKVVIDAVGKDAKINI